MITYILLTNKPWHDSLFEKLKKEVSANWIRLKTKQEFTKAALEKIKPTKIFIPHWSHIIPAEIFENFECIVFHMTNLPYGRGGSPLQNLIMRGHKKTFITAIRVEKGIDTGPVYLKAPLALDGTAEEIFIRSAEVIKQMIVEQIKNPIVPVKQKGRPVTFKRRKPEESNIAKLDTAGKVYDYIRMLDAAGYPKAFLETEHFRFEFSKASLENNKTLIADVRIIKK